jgi:TetR/AcrR family transcriptional regulator
VRTDLKTIALEDEVSRADSEPATGRQRTPVRKRQGRAKADRSQAATYRRILSVATKEFSARGFDGARVDEIVRRSKVSKNLVYHYFDSKEKLFIAVLESAYENMHANTAWPSDFSSATDGIRQLIRAIFHYWNDSPEFIGLLNSENFHKGRHLKKTKMVKAGYSNLFATIKRLLDEGHKRGHFRGGVDPVELYISISSLCYHFFSNRYTLSILLSRDLSSEKQMNLRLKEIEDMVLGYLQCGAAAEPRRK